MTEKSIKFKSLDSRAQMPTKAYPDDACYDLTVFERINEKGQQLNEDTIGVTSYFRTGLMFEPPNGYHLQIYARSSLHKLGYQLATGVSIIDQGYRGEVLIPLIKTNPDVDDLTLPFKPVQMLVSKTEYFHLRVEPTLSQTVRGDHGFGSTTGQKPILQHKLPRLNKVPRSAAVSNKTTPFTTSSSFTH